MISFKGFWYAIFLQIIQCHHPLCEEIVYTCPDCFNILVSQFRGDFLKTLTSDQVKYLERVLNAGLGLKSSNSSQ